MVRSIQSSMRLSLLVRAKPMTEDHMLEVSTQQQDMMIELLRRSDRWALAQLWVENIQPAKRHYPAHVVAR